MLMPEEARPFGLLLYEELKRLGRGALVTGSMKYDGIQRLKGADRAETLQLFHGSNYAATQRIKNDSPEDLAAYMNEQAEEAERQAADVEVWLFVGASLFGG